MPASPVQPSTVHAVSIYTLRYACAHGFSKEEGGVYEKVVGEKGEWEMMSF